MKYLIFLLFFVSSLILNAQKPPENGIHVTYFENGKVKTSGHYKNKKKVGEWKAFYESGELKKEYSYANGKMNPERKTYFKNGNIKSQRLKNEEGKFLKEYYETGELFFEKKLNGGFTKEFYKNGNLKTEGNYVDSELTGLWKKYYETGELEWEINYFNNYKEGSYKQYFKNGTLKVEGENKKDKIHGIEKRYSPEGILEWEGKYSQGKRHGKWIAYNSDEKEIQTLKFKNGFPSKKSKIELLPTIVPVGLIENVPVYPGCEKILGFKNQKKCMASKISEHVSRNFNTEMAANLGLEGKQRIYVIFKIDKQGDIIGARSRAPHPLLEKEAIRVIKLIPKLKPGMQRGKPVVVPYSLPIIFMVQKSAAKKDLFNDPLFKKTN